MNESHLIVLQVVIPLLAAPVCLLIGGAARAWAFACFVAVCVFVCAILLLGIVNENGAVSYSLGGWASAIGIEYRLDKLNALLLLILSGVNLVTIVYAKESVRSEISENLIPLFYTGWLLCITGLLGMSVTADVFNVFVFLEISSLSSYLLIALGKDRRALTAAFNYLIIGTLGATFILISIGMLFMLTGTLNMGNMYAALNNEPSNITGSRTLLTALIFFVIGVSIKIAVFPMHVWLPDAYTQAPSAISALFAGTATKVAVYVLLRFIFGVFGAAYVFEIIEAQKILMLLALAAIVLGSLAAIYQDNIKKLLAFSSVAQIGYMIFGISLVNVPGLTGSLLHLFNHALIKVTLFLAVGCIYYQTRQLNVASLNGIAKRMPFTMATFVLAGLSLIGVPGTAGFVSKWYLLLGALENGYWWLAAIILISSLMAVIYVWRVVDIAWCKPVSEHFDEVREAPALMLLPTCFLALANIYFGLDTSLSVGLATNVASTLLLGTP